MDRDGAILAREGSASRAASSRSHTIAQAHPRLGARGRLECSERSSNTCTNYQCNSRCLSERRERASEPQRFGAFSFLIQLNPKADIDQSRFMTERPAGRTRRPAVSRLLNSIALLLSIVCALTSTARAEFPDRPIRLIVPQAAGSATDTVARILAAELGPALGGSTVIVENKPGGALTHRHRLWSRSRAPDGYTIGDRARSARWRSPATWWRSCPTTSSATSSRSR